MGYDIKEIKENFKKVIKYSQGISNPLIDDLFNNWEKNKSFFIKAFGNQLIYTYPEKVSFELDSSAKEKKFNNFIDKIERYWNNKELADFLYANKSGFYDNQVIKTMYNQKGNAIPQGMKLLRTLKFFETDKQIIEQMQTEASMLIQENKISGTLCLSVHPLDFLSSSENSCNWRSCHSLDGEFRSGNLSYMTDSSTIICYIRSDNDTIINNFPFSVKWNNKKWRMLLHFSEVQDMLFAGRQYPFTTLEAANFILENVIPETDLPQNWSKWYDEKIKKNDNLDIIYTYPYISVGYNLKPMDELITSSDHALNFNDLLCSSVYDPMYAYRYNFRAWPLTGCTSPYTQFSIGENVKCLQCGKEYITNSELFICNECEEKNMIDDGEMVYCSCCYSAISTDEAYWIHDQPVCPSCASREAFVCSTCGELNYNSELVYNREEHIAQCRTCASQSIGE